jgi:hypothetical protein
MIVVSTNYRPNLLAVKDESKVTNKTILMLLAGIKMAATTGDKVA